MDIDDEKSVGTESSIETQPQELTLSGTAVATSSGTSNAETSVSSHENDLLAAALASKNTETTASNAQRGDIPNGESIDQSQHARKPITVTHDGHQHQSASVANSVKAKKKRMIPPK